MPSAFMDGEGDADDVDRICRVGNGGASAVVCPEVFVVEARVLGVISDINRGNPWHNQYTG